MIVLKGNKIKVCKYKLTKADTPPIYSNETKEGYNVEELNVSSELWLDGKECETIQQAKEWYQLGYIPKTELEILKETVDTLVLSELGV